MASKPIRSGYGGRRKQPTYQGPAYLAIGLITLAGMVIALVLSACQTGRAHVGLDVTTVALCPAEDGPALGGPVPCVWDGAERGNGGYYGARWVLYVEACPVTTVQAVADVQCVSRPDWSGE